VLVWLYNPIPLKNILSMSTDQNQNFINYDNKFDTLAAVPRKEK